MAAKRFSGSLVLHPQALWQVWCLWFSKEEAQLTAGERRPARCLAPGAARSGPSQPRIIWPRGIRGAKTEKPALER